MKPNKGKSVHWKRKWGYKEHVCILAADPLAPCIACPQLSRRSLEAHSLTGPTSSKASSWPSLKSGVPFSPHARAS